MSSDTAGESQVSVKDRIVRMSNKLGADNLKKPFNQRNNAVKPVPGKLPLQVLQRYVGCNSFFVEIFSSSRYNAINH